MDGLLVCHDKINTLCLWQIDRETATLPQVAMAAQMPTWQAVYRRTEACRMPPEPSAML